MSFAQSCLEFAFYRSTHAVIMVYDCCDASTFHNVEHWYRELSRFSFLSNEPLLILVANKIDEATKRVVDQTKAEQYTELHELFHYAEISTKTGQGVIELFGMIAKELLHQVQIRVKISSPAEEVSMLLL